MRSQKTICITETALMSAVLCVISPFAIPVPMSLVPFSLATLGVYVAAMLLGAKRGAVCVLVYLFLGMAGLPVFSGFSSGVGVLLGPTGGYLIGYVHCVLVIGWLQKTKFYQKSSLGRMGAIGLGTAVCYAFGTVWFLRIMKGNYTILQALLVCVVPYLLFDVLKIFAAAAVARVLRKNRRWTG